MTPIVVDGLEAEGKRVGALREEPKAAKLVSCSRAPLSTGPGERTRAVTSLRHSLENDGLKRTPDVAIDQLITGLGSFLRPL